MTVGDGGWPLAVILSLSKDGVGTASQIQKRAAV